MNCGKSGRFIFSNNSCLLPCKKTQSNFKRKPLKHYFVGHTAEVRRCRTVLTKTQKFTAAFALGCDCLAVCPGLCRHPARSLCLHLYPRSSSRLVGHLCPCCDCAAGCSARHDSSGLLPGPGPSLFPGHRPGRSAACRCPFCHGGPGRTHGPCPGLCPGPCPGPCHCGRRCGRDCCCAAWSDHRHTCRRRVGPCRPCPGCPSRPCHRLWHHLWHRLCYSSCCFFPALYCGLCGSPARALCSCWHCVGSIGPLRYYFDHQL